MAYSDDFIRKIRKLSDKGSISKSSFRSVFFKFLNGVPEDLCWDIFNRFFPDVDDGIDPDTAVIGLDDSDKFAVIIDLFEGEYEESNIGLSDEELKYITEVVNDYALELSDEVLMNVMKAAVARGLLG